MYSRSACSDRGISVQPRSIIALFCRGIAVVLPWYCRLPRRTYFAHSASLTLDPWTPGPLDPRTLLRSLGSVRYQLLVGEAWDGLMQAGITSASGWVTFFFVS